ncbi:MAG: thioesterase family protein [Gammaproteobacteria bacterium]|nr:thioesterase family protein [Gammaproteobacteria bacterium]MBQ0838917.1 thioesterase family protein [Gammaproteobacteria bacterium]
MSEQQQGQDSEFARSMALRQIDEWVWEGDFSAGWCIGQVPNGGYTLAFGAKVLAAALPHHDPLNVNAYYLARSEPGPVRCEVELLRVGKSTSNGMVKLIQNGEVKIQLIGVFQDIDKLSGVTQVREGIPDMPSYEQCVDMPHAPNLKLRDRLIQRLAADNIQALTEGPNGEPTWRGWQALKDGSDIDLFAVLMFCDALPPPAFAIYGAKGRVPTIEMSVQVHRRPCPGPLRCEFKTRFITAGVVNEDGMIWDSEDNLVALCRQTAKLRVAPS